MADVLNWFHVNTYDTQKQIVIDARNWTGDIEADFRAEQEQGEARQRAAQERAMRYPARYGVLMLVSGVALVGWVISPWPLGSLGDTAFEQGLNAIMYFLAGLGLIVGGVLSLNVAWRRHKGLLK